MNVHTGQRDHVHVWYTNQAVQSTRRPRNLLAPEVARDVTKKPWPFSNQPSPPSYNSPMLRLLELGFSPHMQHSPLLMKTALLFAAVVLPHSKRTLTCPSGRAIFRFTEQPVGSRIARLFSQQRYSLSSSITYQEFNN